MWLAHRGGFTAVVREGEADPGRAKVRVLQSGEVIIVDEDDLEKVTLKTKVLSVGRVYEKLVRCGLPVVVVSV